MPIQPVIPIQRFDDIKREFFEGEIDLSQISDIANVVSVHYGFNRALSCVRVGLGPGKWAYVAAEVATPLREKKAQYDADPA